MKATEVKEKVKAKVKAKVAKAVGRKCGSAKALLIVTVSVFALVGCGSYPAAYSVTQVNEFENSIVIIAAKASVTNGTACAETDGDLPKIDLFSAAQNLENKGTQTADQKSTNEIKPDTDVTVGGMGGSGKGLIEQAVGALVSPSVSATKDCPDGNCSTGACTDGSCSE